MRLTRVYVDAPIVAGKRLILEGSASNHVARVLRLRVGEAVTVFNGSGGEFDARIEAIQKETVAVTVEQHRALDRESPLSITLAQGISRGERMDWVIQKATELGTSRIVPVFTKRSVVRLDEKQAERKLQHWRAIAVAACEQCGRNQIPELAAPVDFYELLELLAAPGAEESKVRPEAGPEPSASMWTTPSADAGGQADLAAAAGARGAPTAASVAGPLTRLLLSPHGEARLADLEGLGAGIVLLIGPEGGLEDAEQEAALNAGFKAVRVGPRVLRTETAAIAALTIIQQRFGDL
jgi:16S rRNA (uracil1498-N3)-methyltransferase